MSASRRLRRSLAVATLALVPATPAVAADDIAVSPAELTRTYRGADGSALYTRAVGEKVVGLGEHPGTRMAFVFEGTRSGMSISGRWWDVAKGTRSRRGELELDYSAGGSTLRRSGGDDLGPDSWQARSVATPMSSSRRWAVGATRRSPSCWPRPTTTRHRECCNGSARRSRCRIGG